jgi:DNA-binding LacI/PurR family transcriptional regulator
MNVHKEIMGKKAVRQLILRINEKEGPVEKLLLSVELVEGQSVKKRV